MDGLIVSCNGTKERNDAMMNVFNYPEHILPFGLRVDNDCDRPVIYE